MNCKKILTSILVSCFSVVLPFTAHAQTGTVSADTLNIRSSTSITSSVIDTVNQGQIVNLLDFDGEWYKVQLSDGTTGFAKSEYIIPGPVYYGTITASSLMVRSKASTESEALAKLSGGTVIELLNTEGNWYKIRISESQYGYVSAEYVSTSTPPSEASLQEDVVADNSPNVDTTIYGYVDASSLNVRESTGTATNVLSRLPRGTKVELLAYDGFWYKIKLADNTIGYASADYISLTPVEADVIAPSNASNLGEAIIQSAYKFMGTPYVYGADGPSSFDCSGFTMYIMNLHGIKLPHHSASQYNYGTPIEKTNLTTGDLVFFNSRSRSGVAHVGIYINDGKFIHASSGSARSVTVSSLYDNYYTIHYLGARRLI